jgi:target of EGR1 protein 1
MPIVLHNGFIDLIFLYEHFYAKCPDDLQKFVADLSEIFSGGVYDTKFISDFHDRSSASFLEYSFNMSLFENTLNKKKSKLGQKFVEMNFSFKNENKQLLDYKMDLKEYESNEKEKMICKNY